MYTKFQMITGIIMYYVYDYTCRYEIAKAYCYKHPFCLASNVF